MITRIFVVVIHDIQISNENVLYWKLTLCYMFITSQLKNKEVETLFQKTIAVG